MACRLRIEKTVIVQLRVHHDIFMAIVLSDRITSDPEVCNGHPTVRGMRITVATILGYLEAGETIDEIIRQHPPPDRDDIAACLVFARKMVGNRHEISELR
jgi:uncharacterized protein (DUF433 family)